MVVNGNNGELQKEVCCEANANMLPKEIPIPPDGTEEFRELYYASIPDLQLGFNGIKDLTNFGPHITQNWATPDDMSDNERALRFLVTWNDFRLILGMIAERTDPLYPPETRTRVQTFLEENRPVLDRLAAATPSDLQSGDLFSQLQQLSNNWFDFISPPLTNG